MILARHLDLAFAPQVLQEVGYYKLLALVTASLITFMNTCLLSYRTWYALLFFPPLSSYASSLALEAEKSRLAFAKRSHLSLDLRCVG